MIQDVIIKARLVAHNSEGIATLHIGEGMQAWVFQLPLRFLEYTTPDALRNMPAAVREWVERDDRPALRLDTPLLPMSNVAFEYRPPDEVKPDVTV